MEEQQTKRYNLKNDVVFKTFFSRKGNEEYLIDFLNALLGIEIKKIYIREEVNLEQLFVEEKGGRLDLQAELNEGIIVSIELQMKKENNITERTATYGAKVMSRSIARGTKYKDIKKVIMVNILNYKLFEYKEYVSETVTVLDKHREKEIIDDIKYYFVELPKFREQKPDMNDKLNQWLAFLDDTDGRLIEMAEKNNKILQKARIEMNELTGEEAVRRLAELREKWEMDRISGLEYAKEEGIQQGIQHGERQKSIEIARKMLNKNIAINEIIEITGLTKDEIEKLK